MGLNEWSGFGSLTILSPRTPREPRGLQNSVLLVQFPGVQMRVVFSIQINLLWCRFAEQQRLPPRRRPPPLQQRKVRPGSSITWAKDPWTHRPDWHRLEWGLSTHSHRLQSWSGAGLDMDVWLPATLFLQLLMTKRIWRLQSELNSAVV